MKMFEKIGEFKPDSLIASADFPILKEGIGLKAGQGILKRGSLIVKAEDAGYIAGTTYTTGSGEEESSEELVGKTLVACTNLAPRKMMGQLSNGMLLSAVRETADGEELHLIMLGDEVPAGCKLC